MERTVKFEKDETDEAGTFKGTRTKIAKRRNEMIFVICVMLLTGMALVVFGTLCIAQHCDIFGLCLAQSPLKIPFQSCGLINSNTFFLLLAWTFNPFLYTKLLYTFFIGADCGFAMIFSSSFLLLLAMYNSRRVPSG
jgi:hypothetical protein